MKNGKTIRMAGLVLMIIGLVAMVVAYIKTDNINNVLVGLVIGAIGSLINNYGKKQMLNQ